MKYYNILFLIILLIFVSCEKDNNIVGPDSGNGKLTIKTDKSIYFWQQSEDNKIIVIQGELQNISATTCFSRVGDSWGESDLIFFAGNSAGKLEKYNASEKKWDDSNLLEMIIEGTRQKEIQPAKKYSIFAHLSISNDKYKEETGKYRLRIDYNDHSTDESEATSPFSDYSNIIEIRR